MTAATLPSERVLTIPNVLSALRLAGVPVFLWLALGPETDGAAFAVLAFAGISDYLDGKLARALDQTSRLGIILDPLADRLYILATVAALTIREIIPWWLAAALIGRDVLLLTFIPVLRRLGVGSALPVHYLGKAATFNLLYAFPLLLLSAGDSWLATASRPVGWAFALWGSALYWWAGLLYVEQVRRLAGRRRRDPGDPADREAIGGARPVPPPAAQGTTVAPPSAKGVAAPGVPVGSAPPNAQETWDAGSRSTREATDGVLISEVREANPGTLRARRRPGTDGGEHTGGTP